MAHPESSGEKLTTAACAARAAGLLDEAGIATSKELAQAKVNVARAWIELGYLHMSEKSLDATKPHDSTPRGE